MIFRIFLQKIVNFLVFIVMPVAFVDGYCIQKLSIDRVETIYFVALLAVLFVWLSVAKANAKFLAYLLALLATMWIGVLIVDPVGTRIIGDTRYYSRSYLLGGLVLIFFSGLLPNFNFFDKFFKFQWVFISLLVIAHFSFGFGGVNSGSGTIRPIYTSYFKEGNAVSFIFVVSWFFWYIYNNNKIGRVAITMITLGISALMSSKAAIIAVVILILWDFLYDVKKNSRGARLSLNIILPSLIIGCAVYFDYLVNGLLWITIHVLPDSATIISRLSSQDVLTVLTSTRNIRVLGLLHDMETWSLGKILFGIGFDQVLATSKLIESDPFDIIQAFGIVGFFCFYAPLLGFWYFLVWSQFPADLGDRKRRHALGVFYATLLVSTLTGHIILTPSVVIVLGVVFGHFLAVIHFSRICPELRT